LEVLGHPLWVYEEVSSHAWGWGRRDLDFENCWLMGTPFELAIRLVVVVFAFGFRIEQLKIAADMLTDYRLIMQ